MTYARNCEECDFGKVINKKLSCRRKPPVVVVLTKETKMGVTSQYKTVWPEVGISDGCGLWAPPGSLKKA